MTIIIFCIKCSFLVRRIETVWRVQVIYFKLSLCLWANKHWIQAFVVSSLLSHTLTLWTFCIQVLLSPTCGSFRSLWWRTSSTTTGSRPPSQCLLLVLWSVTWKVFQKFPPQTCFSSVHLQHSGPRQEAAGAAQRLWETAPSQQQQLQVSLCALVVLVPRLSHAALKVRIANFRMNQTVMMRAALIRAFRPPRRPLPNVTDLAPSSFTPAENYLPSGKFQMCFTVNLTRWLSKHEVTAQCRENLHDSLLQPGYQCLTSNISILTVDEPNIKTCLHWPSLYQTWMHSQCYFYKSYGQRAVTLVFLVPAQSVTKQLFVCSGWFTDCRAACCRIYSVQFQQRLAKEI